MNHQDQIELCSNIDIIVRERGKIRDRRQIHNIFTNIGRQFIAEVITASSFGPTVRHQDDVVRYIGFGMGGSLQNSPIADAAPFDTDYDYAPAGTHNSQVDTDLTVSGLERPVAVTGTVATPGQPTSATWMQEVSAPGTFPLATTTEIVAVFSETDINFGTYTSVPLSEIAIFRGAADPAEANGTAGTYPGPGGHALAYDTFLTFHKTGLFTVEVHWQLRI